MHRLLADLVLVLHLLVVVFVVGGAVVIVVGHASRWRWRWVNTYRLRITHLLAIAIVVAESWLGLTCPLTTLENMLRARAGQPGIGPGFIEHWIQRILFFDLPAWVFIVAYSVFGGAAVWAWFRYPPTRRREP